MAEIVSEVIARLIHATDTDIDLANCVSSSEELFQEYVFHGRPWDM
jgi:hypothetical protein